MKNQIMQKTDQAFEAKVSQTVYQWQVLMDEEKENEAENICLQFINLYKLIYVNREWENAVNLYNKLLICLILVKGLHDFSKLSQRMKVDQWETKNEMIESIWTNKCDCKDRMKFISNLCEHPIIGDILERIYTFEESFRECFGDGYYSSPALIFDKLVCSICGDDARACNHLVGHLYNGVICRYHDINPVIQHVGLVKSPRDPRCRIWDWNLKEDSEGNNTMEGICIMTSFSVDDFIWDKE
jgi:hypothetical protein